MTTIDWAVLIVYILGIIGMSLAIGRSQRSQEDYYLGGRLIRPWQVALSVMATQLSAISLISAPAFIALRSGGGLIWLQYEFAIPLAMMLIMLILIPVYHHTRGITIYEYLENRFGVATRSILSLVFVISRGLGTGVALLATGIVTSVCLGLPLAETIILIGVVSLLYTTIGGIKADIYSDIIQLVVLWGGAITCIIIIVNLLGGDLFGFMTADSARLQILDFKSTGLGDGQTFAFWPMLIGGFFLYLSYYGCDQSQAQRLLTTSNAQQARWAMLGNGLLRFPLVLTYCAFGLLLIPFLNNHSSFAARLQNNPPDFLVPYFLVEFFPKGLLGLVVAGIFAASMSSIDSALNSLSAATWRDFIERNFEWARRMSGRQMVRISRVLTVFWGMVATIFALLMIGGPETVLELVNKIGSAFYGPILATFWLGILTKKASQPGAITGLVAGVTLNIVLWLFFKDISWMWWNVFGFFVSGLIGYFVSTLMPHKVTVGVMEHHFPIRELLKQSGDKTMYITLGFAFVLMVAFCWAVQGWLAGKV
ncbi:MAG: sodium/solute symporter [candidate division Zixibacteria bacterium]|nr:sodium/solute symporter [candidate division Zixibacteria bacterium]